MTWLTGTDGVTVIANTWASLDNQFTLSITPASGPGTVGTSGSTANPLLGDLTIRFNKTNGDVNTTGGSITIKDFRDGDLNIKLGKAQTAFPTNPAPQPIKGGELVGGSNDALGNAATVEGTVDANIDNNLYGSIDVQKFEGGGGNDHITADQTAPAGSTAAGDWISAGSGRDIIDAGAGDDLIETGSGGK